MGTGVPLLTGGAMEAAGVLLGGGLPAVAAGGGRSGFGLNAATMVGGEVAVGFVATGGRLGVAVALAIFGGDV